MNKNMLKDWADRQAQSREDRGLNQEPSMLRRVVTFILPGTNKPEPAEIKPVKDTYQGGALIGKMIEALQVLGLPATATMVLAMLVVMRTVRVQAADTVVSQLEEQGYTKDGEELIEGKFALTSSKIALETISAESMLQLVQQLPDNLKNEFVQNVVRSIAIVGELLGGQKTILGLNIHPMSELDQKGKEQLEGKYVKEYKLPSKLVQEGFQDLEKGDNVFTITFRNGDGVIFMGDKTGGVKNVIYKGDKSIKSKHPKAYTEDTVTVKCTIKEYNGELFLIGEFDPCENKSIMASIQRHILKIVEKWEKTNQKVISFKKDIPAPTPTPAPRNWEVNLGTDSGFQLEEAERAFRVDLSVDSTSNPDGNGNYTVQLDANITVISGYDNASGFHTIWDTPAGQKSGEAVFLELPAGTYTFTAIVTDKYGNTSEHQITSRVPGDNAMSSDDKGSIDGVGEATNFRATLAYHFKNGQVKVFGSNTEAGLGAGLHGAGEHIFGGVDIEGGYNFNAQSPFAGIEGRFGATWNKFTTYLRAKYKALVGGDHDASVLEGNLGAEFSPNDTFSIYAEGGMRQYDLGTDDEKKMQGNGQAGVKIRF